MIAPLELTGLTKMFDTPTGPFVAVKDVNAQIEAGEFVCILGHSGCGKSTVLSIIAGLERRRSAASSSTAREVRGPGAERAIVFQAPCLLPWLTARENVKLALPGDGRSSTADAASRRPLSRAGRRRRRRRSAAGRAVARHAAVRLAGARAVARAAFLLLDEPFSQLDSLTRFELQDTLLRVWEETGRVVVMVTHDVDEALYLADRLILMTDGPEATVGEVLTLPFPRPRTRTAVLEHPEYLHAAERVIDFLELHAHQSRVSPLDAVIRVRKQHAH